MEQALATIAVVLAIPIAAVGALLFIPVDYVISARTGSRLRVRARWLFGLLRIGNRRRARAPRPALVKQPRRPRPARRSRGAAALPSLLAIESLVPQLARLTRELVRALGWRRGQVTVHVGSGDPAEIGEWCGVVYPMLALAPQRGALRLEFRPDFERPVFDARAGAVGRLVPVRVVLALGRFVLSPPGFRAVRWLVWDCRH